MFKNNHGGIGYIFHKGVDHLLVYFGEHYFDLVYHHIGIGSGKVGHHRVVIWNGRIDQKCIDPIHYLHHLLV